MSIKQQLDADIKTAMLSGDKTLVTTLRGLKAAILNTEVAENARETGLSEEKVISILQKEAKKRQESADMYAQGGNTDKQQAELAEKEVVEKYLPEQMSEEEIAELVDDVVKEVGKDIKNMGQIIGQVRAKTAGNADGSVIARLVKERLS